MPLAHASGNGVDCTAIGDIAKFVFASDLLGERAQPILASREQHTRPAATRELPRRCRTDAAGRAGDDRYLHTRTARATVTVRPAASRAVALRVCLPLATLLVFQSRANSPAVEFVVVPMKRRPFLKITDLTFFVELATTSRRT